MIDTPSGPMPVTNFTKEALKAAKDAAAKQQQAQTEVKPATPNKEQQNEQTATVV